MQNRTLALHSILKLAQECASQHGSLVLRATFSFEPEGLNGVLRKRLNVRRESLALKALSFVIAKSTSYHPQLHRAFARVNLPERREMLEYLRSCCRKPPPALKLWCAECGTKNIFRVEIAAENAIVVDLQNVIFSEEVRPSVCLHCKRLGPVRHTQGGRVDERRGCYSRPHSANEDRGSQ